MEVKWDTKFYGIYSSKNIFHNSYKVKILQLMTQKIRKSYIF